MVRPRQHKSWPATRLNPGQYHRCSEVVVASTVSYKNECLPYDRTNRRKVASRILPFDRLDLTVGSFICALLKCTEFGNFCLLMLMLVGAWYTPCRPCVVLDVPLVLGECRQFR